MAELKVWLEATRRRVSGRSTLAAAIRYSLSLELWPLASSKITLFSNETMKSASSRPEVASLGNFLCSLGPPRRSRFSLSAS